MRDSFRKRCHVALCLAVILPAGAAYAQQPKLDIKALAGFNVPIFDSLSEVNPSKERFLGWLAGFGARLSRRQAFAEVLLTFNRFATEVCETNGENCRLVRVNSFELPLLLGYVPYKISKFGTYLYGGYVNHFNVAIRDGKTRIQIKNQNFFVVYQALARMGVSFDLYMFNFDFNYSIGLNNATKTIYRTRYQSLQFNLAYVF
jgi:hypothetical protein